jgi:predicted xylose isomerase-like sugar epimerase
MVITMIPTDPAMMERAKLTTLAMSQFENLHSPVRESNEIGDDSVIICPLCDVDWPCPRMTNMLVVQALSMLQQMIPSGGMSGVLARFAGGGQSK